MSFDQIAAAAWQATKSTYQLFIEAMTNNELEPGPPAQTYTIYDAAGQPHACHLCGATDQWVAEYDPYGGVRVYVCEHEPVSVGRGAIRQISTVPPGKVSRVK